MYTSIFSQLVSKCYLINDIICRMLVEMLKILLVYKRFPQPLVQKGKPYYMYNHIDIISKLNWAGRVGT